MLEAILLKNWQAHRKLRLKLSRVTTITGPSDRGKTSVLRALRWLALNRPAGTAFVSHGQTRTRVTLDVDGRSLTRRRGLGREGENSYTVDGQTLKAFGQEVPPAVTEILNLGPANWQGQHDAPFWFADGSGEVSRALNAIINLGAIDGVLGHLAAAVRREGAAWEVAEGAVAEAQVRRLALKGAKRADTALRGVEGLGAALEAGKANAARLRALMAEGVELRARAKDAAERADGALLAIRAGDQWRQGVERAGLLRQIVIAGREFVRQATQPIPEGLPGLERRAGDIKGREAKATALRELVRTARQQAFTRDQAASEETDLNKRFNQLMGTSCPLCLTPLPSPAPTSI